MNLPNKLTILRVILIPFFVFFLISPFFDGYGNYIALAIFIIASLTDMADGKIARKYNLVTNFGKFMDPLADKLLVGAAMICLVEMGRLPAWIVIVIISREFIISMGCAYYHCKRVYHKRLQTRCIRQWNCHCSKLLGKV